MDRSVLEWLLEETTPEVKLRTLKEYEKLPEDYIVKRLKQEGIKL